MKYQDAENQITPKQMLMKQLLQQAAEASPNFLADNFYPGKVGGAKVKTRDISMFTFFPGQPKLVTAGFG